MNDKALKERDAQRDIGSEIVDALRELKAGRHGDEHRIEVPAAAEARRRVGLSQTSFAALLGVSKRTLQDWEQGRRQPSGAARSLIRIAAAHPEVLRELAGDAGAQEGPR